VSVTITNPARTLTLDFTPVIQNEPAEFRVSRATEYSILGTPISTEIRKTQARTRLRLYLDALTKAKADTLVTMLGETGLVTITIMKQFPTTTANPTSYQGCWAEDGKSWVKPRLAGSSTAGGSANVADMTGYQDAYPRNEDTTWDAIPSDLQVYHAEVELIVLRNDEPA
jgi:hypothetical protein